MPLPQVPLAMNGVGANYQPSYLPHPAAVPDPYTRGQPPAHSRPRTWQIPRLSLRIEDLSNPGAELFLRNVRPYDAMRDAVLQVLECLYSIETQPNKFVRFFFLASSVDRSCAGSKRPLRHGDLARLRRCGPHNWERC
jgi:hypothetical protein